ncbi:hypothetical protein JHW43_007088 [Diplocarpon mali]|nr:hypothetical protein JHW43_007088 [Diplocarpon mali]
MCWVLPPQKRAHDLALPYLIDYLRASLYTPRLNCAHQDTQLTEYLSITILCTLLLKYTVRRRLATVVYVADLFDRARHITSSNTSPSPSAAERQNGSANDRVLGRIGVRGGDVCEAMEAASPFGADEDVPRDLKLQRWACDMLNGIATVLVLFSTIRSSSIMVTMTMTMTIGFEISRHVQIGAILNQRSPAATLGYQAQDSGRLDGGNTREKGETDAICLLPCHPIFSIQLAINLEVQKPPYSRSGTLEEDKATRTTDGRRCATVLVYLYLLRPFVLPVSCCRVNTERSATATFGPRTTAASGLQGSTCMAEFWTLALVVDAAAFPSAASLLRVLLALHPDLFGTGGHASEQHPKKRNNRTQILGIATVPYFSHATRRVPATGVTTRNCNNLAFDLQKMIGTSDVPRAQIDRVWALGADFGIRRSGSGLSKIALSPKQRATVQSELVEGFPVASHRRTNNLSTFFQVSRPGFPPRFLLQPLPGSHLTQGRHHKPFSPTLPCRPRQPNPSRETLRERVEGKRQVSVPDPLVLLVRSLRTVSSRDSIVPYQTTRGLLYQSVGVLQPRHARERMFGRQVSTVSRHQRHFEASSSVAAKYCVEHGGNNVGPPRVQERSGLRHHDGYQRAKLPWPVQGPASFSPLAVL